MTALYEYVDATADEQIDFVRSLVSIDSGTDDKAGVDRVGAILARELFALGFEVLSAPQDVVGNHVIARKSAGSGRDVLLVGHLDTVFPRGTAAARPFTIEAGRAYGPGVYDMRGGLGVLAYALRALRDAAPDTWRTLGIRIVLNSDEEPGSDTSREVIASEAQQAALACILEPARAGGEYVSARKGVSRYVVSVRGVAAHSGNQPHLGASAISELAAKIVALDALDGAEDGLTVNVGVLHGGTRVNMVADSADCEVEMRFPTLASMNLVEDCIRRVREPLAVPRTQAAVTGGLKQYPMEARVDQGPLWQLLELAGREIGFEVRRVATGGASDGNTTSRFVPTIDGMGPRGDYAHSPEEYIDVASLTERTKALARFLELWHSSRPPDVRGAAST
jgi:glutamate carboxypeptidase